MTTQTCDDGTSQEVLRPNISGIDLPTTLYRLRLCDGTEVYVFEDALQNITGTYYIVQEIEIIDVRQLFRVKDHQGIIQTLTLEQLLSFVLNGDNITVGNYQHNDGSCAPTPPDCTLEEQQDQLDALNQIIDTNPPNFVPDTDDINFPTSLQRVLLCDGTEVYLFPDELAEIPGTYTILQTIDVTNAQQLFDRGNTITSLDLNDLFCVGLYYAASNPGYSTPPRKNGDIAWMTWQTKNRETQSYSFRYDNLNRLTKAFHSYIDNNMDYTTNQHYDVSVSYDANGNISNLSRKRMPINGTACGIDMDVLTYDYDIENEGNRLLNILDEGETNKGFKYLEGAANYNYDLNGNLIEDFHKDLTISYNYLNLAELVSAADGTIDWLYNADGVKHRKIVTGSNGYVKDYCNGIEYKDGVLEAIYHDEGRVVPDGSGGYFYDFILRDHLGNTRVMFRDADSDGIVTENEILSEANYYPFGEELVGNWNRTATPALNYLYNNKELDSDFGLKLYHYGTRLYDPMIGRFTGTDLIAEKFPWVTTYNYAENSPIANIDLHGLQKFNVTQFDRNRQNLTKEGKAAFQKGQNRAIREVANAVADEVPGVGEAKSIYEGDYTGAAIGLIPGGKKIRALFRGTSEGFKGSRALQRLGITPTSEDPLVSTIFGLESKNSGKGVVHIALPEDLEDVQVIEGNVLSSLEKEIGLEILPSEFANKASITISADDAKNILGEMGISLPSTIRNKSQLSQVLEDTPRLSGEEIEQFINKAKDINQ